MKNQSQSGLSHQIREQNLSSVREALHREQIATVSKLKELTGLSVVTVNKLLEELVKSGEVVKGEQSSLAGGRPAATYQFNALFELILIITCYQRSGHEYAGYSVNNLFGECLERREELLSDIQTAEFVTGIERYVELYPKIAMIGLSMPSDSVGGRVGSAIRHDPQSKNLARHLEHRFHIPVFFETDINAATLGCYKRTPREKYVSGIVLVPGKAPTCGFCYDGNVLRGKDGMAGEVRYFPMYNDVGILPDAVPEADDLAIRTLRAVMCVMNPGLVVVYTEHLKAGLAERLKRRLATPAEEALLPKIEIQSAIRDDVGSGMISLCLQRLNLTPKNQAG